MLTASEQTTTAAELDRLAAAVEVAERQAGEASPWWRHLNPFRTDIDALAGSARLFAEALAAKLDGLRRERQRALDSAEPEHEAALLIVEQVRRSLDKGAVATQGELARAVREAPSKVAAGVGGDLLELWATVRKYAPWVVGGLVLLLAWPFIVPALASSAAASRRR